MNPASILDAQTKSFGELVGNGRTYRVPPFQRDYSWGEAEWDDLWFDLLGAERGEEDGGHYMGYVVVQSSDSRRFEIIDGQQRFATLSILALAVLARIRRLEAEGLEPERNRQRYDVLFTRFIGHVVASSLTPESKLRLNRNDDDFYQSYLVQLRPSNLPKSHLKPSERRLQEAYEVFSRHLDEHFAGRETGEALAAFLEGLGDRLIFTVIQVQDQLRAYSVFETLNARGVKLSSTDLLKNYLFSLVHQQSPRDLEEAERRWARISDVLVSEDLPSFLKDVWNATGRLTRSRALFKTLKEAVRDAPSAFTLMDRLEGLAGFYVKLSDPTDGEYWSPDERRWLRALKTFGVTHFRPLAIATWERIVEGALPREALAKFLKVSAILALRYNIIAGLNPSAMEQAYNEAALAVRRGEVRTRQELFEKLRHLYVDDVDFKVAFGNKRIRLNNRTRRVVHFLLSELEAELSGRGVDREGPVASVEHLLPQTLTPEWERTFPPPQHARAVDRLANYTLLEPALNRRIGSGGWDEKRVLLERSAYALAREASEFEAWEPEVLEQRGRWLASLAVRHWRLDP